MSKPNQLTAFFDSIDLVIFRSFFTLCGTMTFLKLVFGIDIATILHELVRKWLGI